MSTGLEELMVRYQNADVTAAGELVEQLSPQFFRYFLAQTRHRDLAEDLLQDLWLRVHAARHTYRPGNPVLPWLYSIARRVRVDRYRKDRRVRAHELVVENLPEPVSAEPRTSGSFDMQAGMATLPRAQREVVLLLKVAGLSLEEVARATSTTVGAVKQKAHRAYTHLRQLLEGSGNAI